MIPAIETTILQGIVHDEKFTRKVLPYVREEYFESEEAKLVYNLAKDHFVKYGSCPNESTLSVAVDSVPNIHEDVHKESLSLVSMACLSPAHDTNWLVDSTESWCKRRAVYLALVQSISLADDSNKKTYNPDAIPDIMREALAISFDSHIGHNYLSDLQERFNYYHRTEDHISFGLKYFDLITNGGVIDKTLNVLLAGTGVGKSLTMCDIATNMLMQGKNVLYITCEMSEEKIAERMDANLMNINISDIKDVLLPQFTSKLQDIRNKTKGNLYIKEYPTSSAHAGHFDALISELELKQAFKPDVVFVDYINICLSSRYKAGTNANSYTIVKAIAEELRGLACKHSFPLITATQTTRSGFGSSDIELTDTSESWGLPQTADLMLALISTDDLDQLNQIMVKQLKNRYSDPTVHRKFVVGIDRRKMRLYDIEESGQGNIIQVSKASEMSDSDSKFKSKPDKKKYAEFKF
jgi:replicative DNA helicase